MMDIEAEKSLPFLPKGLQLCRCFFQGGGILLPAGGLSPERFRFKFIPEPPGIVQSSQAQPQDGRMARRVKACGLDP